MYNVFHSLPQKVMSFVAGKLTVLIVYQFSMMTGTIRCKESGVSQRHFSKNITNKKIQNMHLTSNRSL